MGRSKVYYYSNMQGVLGWATNAADFRKQNGLTNGYAVRVAHCDVPAPAGYIKTGRGLAHEPAELPRKVRGDANFYAVGVAILAAEMEGVS